MVRPVTVRVDWPFGWSPLPRLLPPLPVARPAASTAWLPLRMEPLRVKATPMGFTILLKSLLILAAPLTLVWPSLPGACSLLNAGPLTVSSGLALFSRGQEEVFGNVTADFPA